MHEEPKQSVMTQPPNEQQPPQTPIYGPPPPDAPRSQHVAPEPGPQPLPPVSPPATAYDQPHPQHDYAQYGHPQYGDSQQPYGYGQQSYGYGQPSYDSGQPTPPPMPPAYAPAPAQYQPLPPAGPGGIFDGAQHPNDLTRPLYGANIGHAIARFFKSYANFRGRASRSEFWWMTLVFWGAFVLLGAFGAWLSEARYAMPYSAYSSMQGVESMLGLLLVALFLGTIVPWIALTWRRLHDANLAGPLFFLTLVPYLGGITLLILTLLPPKPNGRRFDPVAQWA